MTDLTAHITTLAASAADAAKIEKDNGTRALHLSQAALNLSNAHRVLQDSADAAKTERSGNWPRAGKE